MSIRSTLLVVLCVLSSGYAATIGPWDMDRLFQTPQWEETETAAMPGMTGLLYDAIVLQGKRVQVFAYYSGPEGEMPPGGWPAVVCVHGGGGTAFDDWVQLWNDHGYAAISMDLEGHYPIRKRQERSSPRLPTEHPGPSRVGVFGDYEKPIELQWYYHAVAQVILAHSLIRSFPEVNANKVGLTGISWGGTLTSTVMGVDNRFAFAIPVYGCGFLADSDGHQGQTIKPGLHTEVVNRYYDGSAYFQNVTTPTLWVNGTNDNHFTMPSTQVSAQAVRGPAILRYQLEMPHGHRAGWRPNEIYAFADSVVKDAAPLIQFDKPQVRGSRARVAFDSVHEVAEAELLVTADTTAWPNRRWKAVPAAVTDSIITATLPEDAVALYFNATDERGLMTSSEYQTVAQAGQKPNVIFVLTDDQGYGDLSCHGNPILKTPNLDKMHEQSVRFTDFHVSPLCTPTRGALLTGRDPGRNGAYRTSAGRSILHTDERTLGNLFADNGYVTGMFGKWHLGDNAPHRPQDYGFQDVVWHRCGGIGQVSDYWGNDYFDDTYERNGKLEKFEGYCTDVWFREGIRFIEDNKDRPFFLYLPLNAPHTPIIAGEEWSKPYEDKVDREILADYYGMIANIDYNFGLLRQRLEELDLADNTILIFMTDNGTYVGAQFKGNDSEPVSGFNAAMRGRKASIFDGGHRVPFFIRWPKGGLDGGRDIDTLSVHVDLFPTLAELCGIPLPTDRVMDGRSLVPLLKEEKESWDREHVVLQFHGGAAFPEDRLRQEFSCILTERWRLLHGRELYDMEADPLQRRDVAAEHADVVKELWSHYEPYWQSVVTGMKPVYLDIGNPTENPVELCSQDWYMEQGNPPWNFRLIKKLPRVTAPWMVDVKKAGHYRFTLRQYPRFAGKPVVAVRAKVEIAGLSKECKVDPDGKGVVIEMDLPAGKTKLITYLYDEKGEAGGAYFTEVELLETVR